MEIQNNRFNILNLLIIHWLQEKLHYMCAKIPNLDLTYLRNPSKQLQLQKDRISTIHWYNIYKIHHSNII